jgi:PAS domain S-box-containing protein
MAVAAALQGRGRKKTQAQIDRRRERNRILARRTRLRKKFFFESLQKEVVDLQRENAALKDIVKEQLDDDGQELLDQCNASEKLPAAVLEACGENAGEYDKEDFNLVRSIQQSQHSFVITDPSLQDNPIVFASDDFLSLTGYAREEVLGRNCRFLQGTETSQAKIEEIRKGLATGDDVQVTMVNYTADGTPFWNKLFIAALRDSQDNVVNYIGVIVKVAGPEPGDPEHGKVLPGENAIDDDDDNFVDEMESALNADGAVRALDGDFDAAVAAAPSVVRS